MTQKLRNALTLTNPSELDAGTSTAERKKLMQKITPCLWFDGQAEEAANFYASVFKDSKVGGILRYEKAVAEVAGMPAGSVLTVEFELEGQKFLALNGGPKFKFSEAISFMVNVESQEELDYFWDKLSEGGEESWCGWLKDKFVLSWQIVPDVLVKMIHDPDPARSERVMAALMEMKKLDVAGLERAYGEGR